MYDFRCPRCRTIEKFVLIPNFNLPNGVDRTTILCKSCLKEGRKITLKPYKKKIKLKFTGKWSDYL